MADDQVGFALDDFLPYQLAVAASRVSRQFAALYQDRFGISMPEWRVVAHLSQAGSVSVREIHQRVDMDKSKVSRAASRLENAGLITKKVDQDDRRLVELALTTKGRDLVRDMTPVAEAFQRELQSQLGEDAAMFLHMLQKLHVRTAK